MALGRPKAADRPDGVAGTVMEDGKDETVLFIPVGHCRQTAQGERWRAQESLRRRSLLSRARVRRRDVGSPVALHQPRGPVASHHRRIRFARRTRISSRDL